MYKLFKWIYGLGVKHERRRIKLLVAKRREEKPERPPGQMPELLDSWEHDVAIWNATQHELNKLFDPFLGREVYRTVERIAPIDDEDDQQ